MWYLLPTSKWHSSGKINETAVNGENVVTFNHKDSFEFLFQSGDYTVSVRNSKNDVLSFEHVSKVIVRGEPNVIINCLDQFCLVFIDVSTVIIKNCGCYYYGYYYSHKTYYAVYHYNTELSRTKTEIDNMTFTNSKFYFMRLLHAPEARHLAVIIKDTVFEKCIYRHGDRSILQLFFDDVILRINITLNSLKVRNNNLSFIIPVYDFVHPVFFFITFVCHNYFIHDNDLVMKLKGCNLFFKRAQLDFSNNLAMSRPQQAPLYINKCRMKFEHSQVVFKNNVARITQWWMFFRIHRHSLFGQHKHSVYQ